ncbi:MAG: FG-GAP repeat protein [Saprospiraceae bacterium]|nr:FG-GAP repeat protein [Saprospiraceae bacterium]
MGPIKKENISGTEATKTTDLSETNFESNKPNVERQNYSHDIQRAIEYIEQSEYFIRCQELPGELQSPNRKNNMRFSFNNNGFEAQPRVDSSCEWHIAFHLKGLYRGDKLIEGTQTFTRESIDENRLVYEHAGYDVEYINDSKGMRQNFIVAQKPLGDEDLAIRMEVESRNLQLSCTNNEISGKSDDNIVYQYKDLKVWDANEKLLSAMMKLEGNALSIIVDDRTATYPITIDPLSSTPANILEGDQENARFGFSVSSAGDVNGDGFSDVVVGASNYDNGETDEGAAFVYHGSALGISTTAAAMLESDQENATFGYSVSSAGDVNGDGYSDVVVGAYFYDNGQTDEGAAFIYHGAASGVSTTAAATLESNQENARFGYSVASAGDVNGDGYSDVVVGAYLYENGQNNEGAAFVFHGSASGISINPAVILEGNQASAEFGYSVASAGDVNGDGYSDVVVGAHLYGNGETGEGAAFVYHGSVMGTSNTAAVILESNQESAYSGISVGSAGDVNGDGYSDLVVGAYLYDNGQNNEGVALVYHGSASGINTTVAALVESNQANSQFGISVASAGDVNGDGYSDIVVGAFLYDNGQNNEGAAFVYHGSISGISTTTTALLESNQVGATLGYSVASAGDVNGDGYSDVVVGAYFYDNGQTDEGVAFIYLGSTLGISSTAATTLEGDQENARYGYSVASAGDENGDGYSDVLVGASYYHNGETNEGAAFIYHGSSFGINITATAILESNQENAQLGNSIASAGDVNGDGYSDVLVGASYYHNGETDEGASFIFHGNAGGGLLRNIRAFNSNTNTAIQQSNILENDFSLGLFSKNFLGRTKGKLVWETKQQGEPFSSDGGSITNSVSFTADGVFSDLGISGINLTDLISKPGTQTKVRVRLKFDPVTAITGQALGPWQYLPEYTRGAQGMSSNPLKEQQPPIITSFTPTFGCANVGSVTINGANFMNATSVKIGGTNVSSFNVNSDTEIEAIIGSGTTGTIEVVSLAGTGFSVATFTVNPPSIYNSTDNMYYCTITDALAATMTNDGDLIEIPAGTYIEPCMLIDKSVVIKPMGSVTIDCLEMNGTGKIMVLDGDITLNILNLTNGLIRTNGHNLKCGTISGASIDSYVVTD